MVASASALATISPSGRRGEFLEEPQMSSIFERLARLARAEFNQVKAVFSDRDDDASDDLRAERESDLKRARTELERAETMLKRAQTEEGANPWRRDSVGARTDRPVTGGEDAWRAPADNPTNIDAGASAWQDPAADVADHPGVDILKRGAKHARSHENTAFPREIRLAYASLELPMGSDTAAVNAAHEALIERYHPDKHTDDPDLKTAAADLSKRINQAHDRLVAWIGSR
jgi:hypothetical protein